MKHLDVLVAFEVAGVESEDVRNAVNLHGSNEPSVVSFFAQHAIGGDQLFPFCVRYRRYQARGRKAASKLGESLHCELRRVSEAVHISWACGHDPRFNQALCGDAQPVALPEEELHGSSGLRRGRMGAVSSPQDDVRVDETIHSYHLSSRP